MSSNASNAPNVKGTAAARALPILAVLTGALLGGSSGLYIKGLAFSSLAMSSLRMTVPFLLVLPAVARHGLLLGKPGMRRRLFLASALNAGRMLLFMFAYKLTAIGNAVVLLYLWPVFALVIDSVRLRRPLGAAKLGILLLAMGGVVVMNLHKDFSLVGTDLVGSLCMIASALIFAVTAIIFKQALSVISEADTLYFQNAVGAFIYLPFLIAEIPRAPLSHLGLGVVYGVLVGLVGFGLFFVGMKRLPLFQYSALSYCEVPCGLLMGILFLGERMTMNQAIGMALIVAGSLLAQRLRAT
ncbi:MAG TPA: DMT family transporter [Rectinemataceae bacterium]|nr:DMT family transporter [Rectinemataceae bacterium]